MQDVNITVSYQLAHTLVWLMIVSVCVNLRQYLEEDPKVNRIDDSLQLFTSICQNKIFKDVHLVLMLNKVRFSFSRLVNSFICFSLPAL